MLKQIKLEALKASEVNPRLNVEDIYSDDLMTGIAELATSIQMHGILQPLLVSPAKDGGYTIVAGHRRAQAAQIAGLTEVPCIVRKVQNIAQAHLVENIQREDLKPSEIGLAVYEALREKKIKAKQLAAELGKSEPWISKARTIGEAATKFANNARLMEATSTDDAYQLANDLLNPAKAEARKKLRDEKAQQEEQYEANRQGATQKPVTLEDVIRDWLNDKELDGTPYTVTESKDSIVLSFTFKTEASARKLFRYGY